MTLSKKFHLLWLLPLLVLAILYLLPAPEFLLHPPSRESTRILDRHGALLYELRKPDAGLQQELLLTDVPQACLDGIIAVEDRDFFSHPGVSLKGIVRAAWQNITSGRIVSGGSTLTQQLVRNRLAPRRRTLLSKITEALLALKLEQKLSKEQILEAYIGAASFGHQAEGLAAAAKIYFGKSPQELSVAECALLAGLPQAPTSLDPFEHFKAAKARQERVLTAMRETGALSEAAAREALAEPLTLARDTIAIRAPHFVLWQIASRPDALSSSTVQTTLDLNLQTEVERIVSRHLEKLAEQNVTSAAVVVLDRYTGDLLTMVGSADYFDHEHDGAVNVALAPRQPGSALKPFTYALALAHGATAATTVADSEAQFLTQEGNPYTPRNYDFETHGLVRYREALANSYNIAAVKVLERVGVANLLTFLTSAGITTLTQPPEHYGLALTLGDAEVKLLELTQAYGIFPRWGKTLPLRTLLNDSEESGKQILDPKVAWLITDILSDNAARLPEFGEESPLAFDFPAAAKTGTTRNSRDNWTIGFTPDILVGVWVGNADNSPMHDTSGVTGAGPIFHDVLLAAVKNLPPKNFPKPPGIVVRTICRLSGKLPTPSCPHTLEEYFIAGTEPTEQDDIFTSFLIDTRNGLLANKFCDHSFTQEKAFAVFPKDVEKWARENGWPAAPPTVSPLCHTPLQPRELLEPREPQNWLEITRPQPGDSFELDPLIPDTQEHIIFEAHASPDIASLTWFVNGTKVGAANAPDFRLSWKPTVGRFTVEARAQTMSAKSEFEVAK